MNNPQTLQIKQGAIWYYSANGSRNGPLTTAALIQLYQTGVIKNDTLVWKPGLPGWEPLSQAMQNGATEMGPTGTGQSMKSPLLVGAVAVVLIVGLISGYFHFFAKTPLDGGWQGKNILGITNGIMLFDGDNCWYCDANNKPLSVNYQAVKVSDKSYKVTLSGNNQSMDLMVSFVDNDTINVSTSDSTQIDTLTRIDKAMAKSMMGIE